MRPRDHRGPRAGVAVARHEAADAVERLGGDAAAVAKPAGELAVVDRAAAEGGFRPGRSAGNNRKFPATALARSWRVSPVFPRVPRHPFRSQVPGSARLFARLLRARALSNATNFAGWVNHKVAHHLDGIIYGQLPISIISRKMQVFLGSRKRGCDARNGKNGFCGQRPTSTLPLVERKCDEIQGLLSRTHWQACKRAHHRARKCAND